MTITPLSWMMGLFAIKQAYDKDTANGKYCVHIGLNAKNCPETKYFTSPQKALKYAENLLHTKATISPITGKPLGFPTCFFNETKMGGFVHCVTPKNIGELKCQYQ